MNEPESPSTTPAGLDDSVAANRPPPSARPTSARRRLIALGIGLALAAVLAFVLYGGINHSPPQATTAGTVTPPPGLDAASVDLLDLSPVPGPLAAPDFHLVDQEGRPASLSQFRGKVVIWSLNDDQCTDLCALLAQDIVAAEADLGPAAEDVVFVSVNANPYFPDPANVKAWSVRNDLESFPNWVYVTGSPAQLKDTWNAYHVTVQLDQKDRTVTHDAALEFIDPTGHTRDIGFFSQGAVSTAFYAHAMAQVADDLLPSGQQVHVGGTAVGSSATRGATLNSRAPGFDLPALGGTGTTNLSSSKASRWWSTSGPAPARSASRRCRRCSRSTATSRERSTSSAWTSPTPPRQLRHSPEERVLVIRWQPIATEAPRRPIGSTPSLSHS